jgi:hypothetical protein
MSSRLFLAPASAAKKSTATKSLFGAALQSSQGWPLCGLRTVMDLLHIAPLKERSRSRLLLLCSPFSFPFEISLAVRFRPAAASPTLASILILLYLSPLLLVLHPTPISPIRCICSALDSALAFPLPSSRTYGSQTHRGGRQPERRPRMAGYRGHMMKRIKYSKRGMSLVRNTKRSSRRLWING